MSSVVDDKLAITKEFIRKLKELKPIIENKYGVKEIGIFGSYIRGDYNEESDLDILVDFNEPITITLFDFIELRDFLEEQLNIEVDLVMKSALKPRIGKYILQEVVYI